MKTIHVELFQITWSLCCDQVTWNAPRHFSNTVHVNLLEQILAVGVFGITLGVREIQEMAGAMRFSVEFLRVIKHELVFHTRLVLHAHKIIIPNTLLRDHEEAEENIGQEHLNLLCVRREVTCGVGAGIFVGLAPLETLKGDAVRRERT